MDRGANRHGAVEHGVDLHGGRNVRGELRQLRLDELDGIDDVRAGQLPDAQQYAGLVVWIAGDVAAGGFQDRLADVAYPQGGAVAVGQDHIIERIGLGDLVVGRDRVADLGGEDRALGGIARGLDEAIADLLQGQADRGKLRRVDLHPDRRLLVTDDRGLCNAGHL